MKKIITALLLLTSLAAAAKKDPTEQAKPIVEEGKLLYRSEMASWYGTDLFLEKYTDRENIGGYFSYTDGGEARCVFFSKADAAQVIGTISFDSTYNTSTARVEIKERSFTPYESDLYVIRKKALSVISSDTSFKMYKNTNFNLIPLITGNEKKVYVLTGPKENGVVIFGNDYLLTFDKDNRLSTQKQLHRNIIAIPYGEKGTSEKAEETIHSHLPETGDFITATDICTLMLYSKFAGWKQHHVVSAKYLNIWSCETNQLTVIPTDVVRKINKHQEKRNKKG